MQLPSKEGPGATLGMSRVCGSLPDVRALPSTTIPARAAVSRHSKHWRRTLDARSLALPPSFFSLCWTCLARCLERHVSILYAGARLPGGSATIAINRK